MKKWFVSEYKCKDYVIKVWEFECGVVVKRVVLCIYCSFIG